MSGENQVLLIAGVVGLALYSMAGTKPPEPKSEPSMLLLGAPEQTEVDASEGAMQRFIQIEPVQARYTTQDVMEALNDQARRAIEKLEEPHRTINNTYMQLKAAQTVNILAINNLQQRVMQFNDMLRETRFYAGR